MSTAAALRGAVRDAWASIPAPPATDLQLLDWGWGEEAARAFEGVVPVDVDRSSHGFHAATPLLDLPAPAAAAYLGTYLMALLDSIEFQQAVGIFDDALTRAHTLTCLTLPDFWERVIRPELPDRCRHVLADVVAFVATTPAKELLAVTDEQADTMLALAA